MRVIPKFIFFCFAFFYSLHASQKILIFSSHGGYGHGAAAESLETILGKNYNIKIVYPIEKISFLGVQCKENIYNNMLQHGWTRSLNLMSKHIAPKLFRNKRKNIERLIDRYIACEKPDLIISLIPFINYPATEAARKRNIPYLLITTDNDLRNWVHSLHCVTHPNFQITIGDELPSTTGLLKKRHIPKKSIHVIGLPIRTSFKVSKDRELLYQEYAIPKDKPVILIMMGGAGGEKCLDYTHIIGNLSLGVHMIVCVGKNEILAQKINKLKLNPSNSITVMGFTNNMADLMALSHLIITKPGPGVINEALSLKVPLLIDKTSSLLSWERANIELVLKYQVGEAILNMKDLPDLLNKYLIDPVFRKNLSQAFDSIPSNKFNEHIQSLIHSMCIIQESESGSLSE